MFGKATVLGSTVPKSKSIIPMFGQAKTLEWKLWLKKWKSKIPMSGTAKMENSNDLKTKIFNSSVWKKPKSRIPEFQCLKKATILNSNTWKSQNRNWIPVYGRKKSSTPNVWKIQKTEIVCLENKKIVNSNVL